MKPTSRRLAAIAATAGLLTAGAPAAVASAHPGPSGSVPIHPMLPGGPLALAPLVVHHGG